VLTDAGVMVVPLDSDLKNTANADLRQRRVPIGFASGIFHL